MNMSKHASVRSQQRGIPPMLVDLLFEFGASEKAHDGASKLYFDKSASRRLQAYAGPLSSLLEQHLDVYVVVADDATVITVAHRLDRIRRN